MALLSRTIFTGTIKKCISSSFRRSFCKNHDTTEPTIPTISHLLEANKKWAEKSQLSKIGEWKKGDENPDFLWIGCSDARVPANVIVGQTKANLFVHRNIANQVNAIDSNLMSIVQYAVEELHVPHIVVCGHYDCGGIRAAMSNTDHASPLQDWLRSIKDVYFSNQKELDSIEDDEMRHKRLVELNVLTQCLNLFKTGWIQRRRERTNASDEYDFRQPRIHPIVFQPTNGEIKPLQFDFRESINEITGVYGFAT